MDDEAAERIYEELSKIIQSGAIVIVEGKKDKLSLEYFGVTNIIMLDRPLFEIVEELDAESVILLTDLDAEGRKLYKQLKEGLTAHGIKVNDKLRRLLAKAKIVHVESLAKTFEKWKSQKE
jgi:5S rRNA maturation endonuclease (ribonuclease M5)